MWPAGRQDDLSVKSIGATLLGRTVASPTLLSYALARVCSARAATGVYVSPQLTCTVRLLYPVAVKMLGATLTAAHVRIVHTKERFQDIGAYFHNTAELAVIMPPTVLWTMMFSLGQSATSASVTSRSTARERRTVCTLSFKGSIPSSPARPSNWYAQLARAPKLHTARLPQNTAAICYN